MGLYNWNLHGLHCIILYNTKCIIQHLDHLIRSCYPRPSRPRPRIYPWHACRRCLWICQRNQIHQCYHQHHPRPCRRGPRQVQLHICYQGTVATTICKTLYPSL